MTPEQQEAFISEWLNKQELLIKFAPKQVLPFKDFLKRFLNDYESGESFFCQVKLVGSLKKIHDTIGKELQYEEYVLSTMTKNEPTT